MVNAASVADALGQCRRDIVRFARSSDRRTLLEAATFLVLARATLSALPFGTVQRLIARTESRPGRLPRGDAACIGRAVSSVARRLPAMTCLVQAVAAQAMLRRRGYEPVMRFGVRSGGTGGRAIDAHAWLVCDGRVVVGENVADGARRYETLERTHPRQA